MPGRREDIQRDNLDSIPDGKDGGKCRVAEDRQSFFSAPKCGACADSNSQHHRFISLIWMVPCSQTTTALASCALKSYKRGWMAPKSPHKVNDELPRLTRKSDGSLIRPYRDANFLSV